MTRTRDWRRYKQLCIVIKRIKKQDKNTYWFEDANKIRIKDPHWYDLIGTIKHFKFKSKGSYYYKYGLSQKWRNNDNGFSSKKNCSRNYNKKRSKQLVNEYLYDNTNNF